MYTCSGTKILASTFGGNPEALDVLNLGSTYENTANYNRHHKKPFVILKHELAFVKE